jgi:hypothetical protein
MYKTLDGRIVQLCKDYSDPCQAWRAVSVLSVCESRFYADADLLRQDGVDVWPPGTPYVEYLAWLDARVMTPAGLRATLVSFAPARDVDPWLAAWCPHMAEAITWLDVVLAESDPVRLTVVEGLLRQIASIVNARP